MIKRLERIIETDENGNNCTSRLPNPEEMMDKINEIIDHLNKRMEDESKIIEEIEKGF